MNGIRQLAPYLRRYPRHLIAGVLSILLAAVVGLLTPLFIGRAVDSLYTDFSERTLVRYALLLFGFTALRGVFNYLQRRVLVAMSRHVEFDLRNDFYRHLQAQPQSFFESRPTGDLMARATNDLQAVRMVCGPAIMYGGNTLFSGTGALLFMMAIDVRMTVLTLCSLPLIAIATKIFGSRIHREFENVQKRFSHLSTKAQENFSGVRLVRAYAQEEAEERGFRELNRSYVDANRRLILLSSAFHPLLQVLIGVGYVAVLWYGGLRVTSGAISVGEFVSFNFFLAKLTWPMIAIGWVINIVQRGAASLGRILEILAQMPTVNDERAVADRRVTAGRVEFRQLDFSYGEDLAPVLEGLELIVEPGQTIGIVGRTGSGKTTLLSLLPRLRNPLPGTLFIDGSDALEIPLARLRSAISMVPQETFLFSASVRDNVLVAEPGASEAQLEQVVHWAGLDRDLEGFPAGLGTLVGERGITLSGGQKQRVALARALLRKSEILLLDDCLSAVDTETEERILKSLASAFVQRTVFLVSHRVSALQHADRILVLERGRLVASGTHEELIDQQGPYRDLYRRQMLEDELAAVS